MDIPLAAQRAIITMTEAPANLALLRLMTWLSPAFPVGGFSYSHGIERAVLEGWIGDAAELEDWLTQLLQFGSGWNDGVLLAESWRRASAEGDLTELSELAEALAGSEERHRESVLQGAAFVQAASAWPLSVLGRLPANCPYSIGVGAVAGASRIGLEQTLAAFLQAFAASLVQASIRLGVIGQKRAVAVMARLETVVLDVAARAAASSIEDLGSATFLSDVAAMRHEVQHTRLFRT